MGDRVPLVLDGPKGEAADGMGVAYDAWSGPGDSAPDASTVAPAAHSHNQLGTFVGCYVPCALNIMGIILFLRLPWAVGQVGILGMLAILAISETMAVLTVLSLSALVCNGDMKGGGNYFLISRSLGPAAGGSIGILFYLGFAMGGAFYSLGAATTIQTTWFPNCDETIPGDDAPYVCDGHCVSIAQCRHAVLLLIG